MKVAREPRAELLGLAAELRHLRGEHLRAGPESTIRRHLETRIHEVTYHMDRRLDALLDDEADRAAWRHHAHGGPAPERPPEAVGAAIAGPPADRPAGRRPWPR